MLISLEIIWSKDLFLGLHASLNSTNEPSGCFKIDLHKYFAWSCLYTGVLPEIQIQAPA